MFWLLICNAKSESVLICFQWLMSHANATVQRVRVHACPSIKDHPVQTTTSTKSSDAQTTPGKIAHQAQQCYKEQQQRNAYWNKGGTIEHCPTADINDSACLSLLFSHSEEGSSQVLRYIGQTSRCLNNRTREHAESLKRTPPDGHLVHLAFHNHFSPVRRHCYQVV